MMNFGNLHYLWLLWLLPIMGLFFIYTQKSKRKAFENFAKTSLAKILIQNVNVRNQKIKPFLILGAVFFIIVALIEPKWGYHFEEMKRRGLDIIVALDVSHSMLAEDIQPNRLEAAKREVKSLINMLKGDRIGLITFSGTAFTSCPLTLDYGVAKSFLDNIDVETIPVPGTNIGGAIRNAIRSFSGYSENNRILILITDGEEHNANAIKAAKEAKDKGLIIFTVGIGSSEGAPIPIIDDGGRRQFLKDRKGNTVLTKLDTGLLQKLAIASGGTSGILGGGEFPLEDIYLKEIDKMEKNELETSRRKRYENRYQIPLFIALCLLVLESLISERKRRVTV